MTDKPILVLKIGGNQVDDPAFLAGFVAAVRDLLAEHAVVVVHGGGKEIADLHARFGVPFETVQGLRVTSPESMRLVEMALNGSVNTRLVRWLVNGGVDAIGLSGVDMGLVRVVPMHVDGRDLGLVGQVWQVNARALAGLLGLGLVPVISPVSLGQDGQVYNVNADQAAAGVARALGAASLIFVTNVPGVRIAGRAPSPASGRDSAAGPGIVAGLSPAQVQAFIASGEISGGMIPKVRAALEAVECGVCRAVITDLAGLASGGGTAVTQS